MKTGLGPVMLDVVGESLEEDDIRRLQHPATGAVILFTRNFKNKLQLTELIQDIKSIRAPGLLVCVDQEGGRVQRFRDGFTTLPAAAEIGALYDSSIRDGLLAATAAAELMASELAETGLDFSFAPVLDVLGCESEVIGDRSFHRNPEVVAELGAAWIDGMNAAGMASTGKHFPGHGGVEADSHTSMPTDNRDISALQACDMLPFERLAGDLDAVMTAHVLFDAIEPEIPTFSRHWLQEVLRQQLGFSGVIFSDDLSMEGAKQGGIIDCGTRALVAGCDMILVCNAPESADELLDSIATQPELLVAAADRDARLGRMRRRDVANRRAEEARELLRGFSLIS